MRDLKLVICQIDISGHAAFGSKLLRGTPGVRGVHVVPNQITMRDLKIVIHRELTFPGMRPSVLRGTPGVRGMFVVPKLACEI